MQLIEQIISIVAPHYCIECGAEGKPICSGCAQNVFNTSVNCLLCDQPTAHNKVCNRCRRSSPLQYGWSIGEYDGAVEKLVQGLKFGRQQAVATVFAEQLDNLLPYFEPSTVVTWLPTAPRRVRVRGYDQAELIAREFARRRGLECQPLLRRTHNLRQLGATKRERAAQAKAAYKLRKKLPPCGRPILLIDDVLTTGASLNAAASLLRAKGHSKLMAATVATQPLEK